MEIFHVLSVILLLCIDPIHLLQFDIWDCDLLNNSFTNSEYNHSCIIEIFKKNESTTYCEWMECYSPKVSSGYKLNEDNRNMEYLSMISIIPAVIILIVLKKKTFFSGIQRNRVPTEEIV